MSDLLFVYGTLRRGGGHELEKMFDDVRFVQEAEFFGEMFLVDYFPGVIDPVSAGTDIAGEIYEFRPDGKSLRKLDEFEDYRPFDPDAGVYVRARRNVRVKSGEIAEVWIYIYNQPVAGFRKIESGDFVRFLKES